MLDLFYAIFVLGFLVFIGWCFDHDLRDYYYKNMEKKAAEALGMTIEEYREFHKNARLGITTTKDRA